MIWQALHPSQIQKILSRNFHGHWDQLETIKGRFLSLKKQARGEEWFFTTTSETMLNELPISNPKLTIKQVGVLLGEYDHITKTFNMKIGGLLTFGNFFHPRAIARHVNSFLSGNVTTCANPESILPLTPEKQVLVISEVGTPLGLARIHPEKENKNLYLEPILTTKIIFQQEWREKRKHRK